MAKKKCSCGGNGCSDCDIILKGLEKIGLIRGKYNQSLSPEARMTAEDIERENAGTTSINGTKTFGEMLEDKASQETPD